MKIRNLMVLLLIAVCASAAFAGGGQQAGSRPASMVNPGEEAGFEEFPLGDDFALGPLNVAGVYFQPVDMLPASAGLPASQSDMHMEADISAAENDLGYGVGDFVPNLTVQYEIIRSTGEKGEGTFMPMNASDGPHYGANVKLPGPGGPGTYTVRFLIQNPEAQGYVLHVDQATGVPGRFWGAPLVAEWTVDYAGPAW
ncbi:MAG: iron transporter [Treponema sp.]|jgi:uncharacterized protein involved in high-affinity Fe2+ transport|nr:iron transporter [Treponema sp.]